MASISVRKLESSDGAYHPHLPIEILVELYGCDGLAIAAILQPQPVVPAGNDLYPVPYNLVVALRTSEEVVHSSYHSL